MQALRNLSFQEVYDIFSDFYRKAPFVHLYLRVVPEVKFVNGSNGCHIGFAIDKRTEGSSWFQPSTT